LVKKLNHKSDYRYFAVDAMPGAGSWACRSLVANNFASTQARIQTWQWSNVFCTATK
jgi:hypothetical protein